MKSPYDQLEGYNGYNLVMASSSSFVLKKHDKSQEREHCWLFSTTRPPTKVKPRTVCYQKGEDDEDMIPKDMTIKYMVSLFLCLQNNICKNLMVPNGVTFNMLRNNDEDDDVNLGKTLSMASTIDRTYTTSTRLILECNLIEAQHSVRWLPDSASLEKA
jgi:hypothetical protein